MFSIEQSRSLKQIRALTALAMVACAILTGCRTRQATPPGVAGPPRQAITVTPDVQGALSGRVICLDPGHGGPWPGAVAPSNGLREADVNLAVGLALREMLLAEGATVTMTRTDDSVPVPSNMSADLAARAAMAEGSDVFISIHHNADIVAGSTKNDLEIYYKRGDDGPSLDLGQALTSHLAKELRVDAAEKRLLPGNYSVLRKCPAPAVLVETAYLTHEPDAVKFSAQAGTSAEARALFEGLRAYFSLDPPRIAGTQVLDLDQGRTQQVIVSLERGQAIAPASIRALLNGEVAKGDYNLVPGGFAWTFEEPLPNGDHTLVISARNILGAAVNHRQIIRINRAPTFLELIQHPPAVPPGSGVEFMIEARAYDALGLPVADATEVRLLESGQSAPTKNGAARFYLKSPNAATSYTVECDEARGQIEPQLGAAEVKSVRVIDSVTQRPVTGAVASIEGRAIATSTAEGWMILPADAREVAFARAGYELRLARLGSSHNQVTLNPVDGAALHGKRIALDPFFGGRQAGAIGPTGTRASDVSLDVAQRAASHLRRAGAEVIFTRPGDGEVSELARVAISDEEAAELFIGISFGAPGTVSKVLGENNLLRANAELYVGHYPDSPNGARLAHAIASQLPGLSPAPAVAYVLQQTGCPAVLVQPGHVAKAADEQRYQSQQEREQIAYAIYRGIRQYFGPTGK